MAGSHRRQRILSLTNNFETGGAESCTGSEVNLVRALAAGGIKDTPGLSNVMYAGTDGLGPALPYGRPYLGGNESQGGADGWIDRTGSTNPRGFPISAIALNHPDPPAKPPT